mmetsp:Transcript_29437/g.44574  ORF Transcript_29437/g.44574 Transcript_29437/m.44574 type:complete len:115 (+) Transcript_29437:3853-4197(+)
MVSTTQNVKESVWEYGCLRAIGVTKRQGMAIAMYEQYSLIIASLFLGSIVGFILASVVTAQFFLFLEYPFELIFPFWLFGIMIGLALLTTFFAVWGPVGSVNRRQIAQVVRGLS